LHRLCSYLCRLRLEDPFAPHIRGRSGLDSVRVDELCEITRRVFLKVEREAASAWDVPPPGKEKWAQPEGGSAALLPQCRLKESTRFNPDAWRH